MALVFIAFMIVNFCKGISLNVSQHVLGYILKNIARKRFNLVNQK